MPGAAAADDPGDDLPAPSAPTANTLSARAVRVDPHDGHLTSAASAAGVIDRCNCSNFASQAWHVYS
jgi:hypothetical protein